MSIEPQDVKGVDRRMFLLGSLGLVGGIGISAILTGCGGGHKSGGASGSTRGRVELHISWPAASGSAPSRYIPRYAGSIRIVITRKDDSSVTYPLLAVRPAAGANGSSTSQVVALHQEVRVGTYTLTGEACTGADGTGTVVASGATEFEVQFAQLATPTLTLGSTVQSVQILTETTTLVEDDAVQMMVQVTDATGASVLVPPGTLDWSVDDATHASVSSKGLVQANATGQVTVRVHESGANVQDERKISVTPLAPTTPWPLYGFDAQHTNRSNRKAPIEPAIVLRTKVRPSSGSLDFPATPLVIAADNTVYYTEYTTTGFPETSYATIFAANGNDGTVRWSGTDGTYGSNHIYYTMGTGTRIEYAVRPTYSLGQDGTFYFGTGESNRFSAFDGGTGALLWRYELPPPPGAPNTYINGASTLGPDGTVYVGTVGQNDAGNYYAGYLLALDGKTGTLRWKHRDTKASFWSCPALGHDGTLYFGSAGETDNTFTGSVTALDSVSGGLKWTFKEKGRNFYSAPSVGSDGTVYIGRRSNLKEVSDTPGGLYALNGATGAVKWFFPSATIDLCPAIGADGILYLLTDTGDVYALDSATGAVKWILPNSKPVGSSEYSNYLYYPPFLDAEGILYVVPPIIGQYGYPDRLLAIETRGAAAGTVKWELPNTAWAVIGAHRTLFVLNNDQGQAVLCAVR